MRLACGCQLELLAWQQLNHRFVLYQTRCDCIFAYILGSIEEAPELASPRILLMHNPWIRVEHTQAVH